MCADAAPVPGDQMLIRRKVKRYFTALCILLLLPYASTTAWCAVSGKDSLKEVIVIHGQELAQLNLSLPDGGLMPVPGVLNKQIFRASRDVPETSDGDGWTYAHHMDLAVWKGRMYAAWNMTLKDEDRLPSKVVFATSPNGIDWSKPADLFPREWAWACRFYFFQSGNGRMLAFCAAKTSDEGKVSEDKKSILAVREVRADHTLGEVFILINPAPGLPAHFETSPDKEFVLACREAVDNNTLLEQQDYGVFLGDRKMEWHEKAAPYKGFYKFGKAFCFYHRADGILVGMSKMGFVTLSRDEGKTWSEPTLPPTLTAGAAKVWGQKTVSGNFILAYNPDPKKGKRFPLVLVQGNDGINFQSMQVIHGEYSPLRYPGLYKDIGYQYVRGIPEWSNDHSLDILNATWLIYSVNKEDIWISRIPSPEASRPAILSIENFQKAQPGSVIKGWNLYSPRWAPVMLINDPAHPGNKCLELRDADPVDHAQAQRIFPPIGNFHLSFRVLPMQSSGYLEASLEDASGKAALRIVLDHSGQLHLEGAEQPISPGNYKAGEWLTVDLKTDRQNNMLQLWLNGRRSSTFLVKWESPVPLQRLVFRTGKRYGLMEPASLSEGQDRPDPEPKVFLLDDVTLKK